MHELMASKLYTEAKAASLPTENPELFKTIDKHTLMPSIL